MSKFARCCYVLVPAVIFILMSLLLVGAFTW